MVDDNKQEAKTMSKKMITDELIDKVDTIIFRDNTVIMI